MHNRLRENHLEGENADLGVEQLHDSTVKILSIGCDEVVVSPRADSPSTVVEGFSSLNASCVDEISAQELNVEARGVSDPASSIVPASNEPSSPDNGDSEDGNLATHRGKNIDSHHMDLFKGVGPSDGGVHDDDDESSESDLDNTCFESYLAYKYEKFKRYQEIGWKSPADMLSAFQNDFEPCMNAVCVLYRQKVASKKSYFSRFLPKDPAALSLKALAEYLMDGDPQKKLRKTVSEVQQEDPSVLSQRKDLAIRYCDILFDIYSKGGDHLFRPDL